MMIKGLIYQVETKILNLQAPIITYSKYIIKDKMIEPTQRNRQIYNNLGTS